MPDHAKCRSCNADILWCVTESGKKMPLDTQSCSDGTVAILPDDTYKVLSAVELLTWEGPKFKSHFATCPNHARHRRKKTND